MNPHSKVDAVIYNAENPKLAAVADMAKGTSPLEAFSKHDIAIPPPSPAGADHTDATVNTDVRREEPSHGKTAAQRNRWILRAGLAAVVAFAVMFLVLTVFVLALVGLDRLRQPVAFGVWGPALASELARLGLAFSGLVAAAVFAGVVLYGLMDLRSSQPNTAPETFGKDQDGIPPPNSAQPVPVDLAHVRFGSYGLYANGDIVTAVGPQHVMIGGQVQPITSIATKPGFLGWHNWLPEDKASEAT